MAEETVSGVRAEKGGKSEIGTVDLEGWGGEVDRGRSQSWKGRGQGRGE